MKKKTVKTSLSLVALLGLTLFNSNSVVAEGVNPANYLPQTSYGEGEGNLYYKFDNSNGGYRIIETAIAEEADVTVKYNNDPSTYSGKISNTGDDGGDINKNFVELSGSGPYGSAIYNPSGKTLGNISGDFIKNVTTRDVPKTRGGAIGNGTGQNVATIGNISGTFAGNSAINTSTTTVDRYSHATGGAISNNQGSVSGDISGVFVGNYAESTMNKAYGGAIFCDEKNTLVPGSITRSISGTYIGNWAHSFNDGVSGGALMFALNTTVQKSISGTYIGNYILGASGSSGGAIAVAANSTIGSELNGSNDPASIQDATFYANYVESYGSAAGGALRNAGNLVNGIDNTVFTGNYAITLEDTDVTSDGGTASAGAIHNSGNISKINADFTQNYAKSISGTANGGAILNKGTLGDIKGTFNKNYVDSAKSSNGGAIFNDTQGTINSIKDSTLTENYTKSAGTSKGGATYNLGKINEISNVKFEENYATSTGDIVYGGAIYNEAGATITDINNSEFNKNSSTSSSNKNVYGGAIANIGSINNLEADFTENGVTSRSNGYGGAIFNNSANAHIDSIKGTFTNNYTSVVSDNGGGGAIYNSERATIGNIDGDFINNHVASDTSLTTGDGGAIVNISNANIGVITGNFTNNYINANTGGSFIVAASGGAITNTKGAYIEGINGNFVGNHIESTSSTYIHGGAIMNSSVNGIGYIKGDFENNYVYSKNTKALGGAISNAMYIDSVQSIPSLGSIYGSFRNNYAKTDAEGIYAVGGAIYTRGNIDFIADATNNEFTGNYTEDKIRGKVYNGIFVRTNIPTSTGEVINQSTLTFDAKNGGSFVFDDNIDGGEMDDARTVLTRENQYNIKFKGDESGTIKVNNDILNANITHEDVTTTVKDYQFLNHAAGEGINSLTMNSGILNLGSMTLAPLHFETFAMNGGIINIDNVQVDLQNRIMSQITANNYEEATGGTVNVKSMTLLNDSDYDITPVKFADKSFKNTVTSDVKKAYGSIYEYDVEYDTEKTYEENGQEDEDGYFVFLKNAADDDDDNDTDNDNDNDNDDDIKPIPPTPSDPSGLKYNPAILATPVAMQAAANGIMGNTLLYSFEHAHYHMMSPAMDRLAMERANRYAISSDYNNNMDLTSATQFNENKDVWVKPYTSFENMHLQGGPKVDMITYGMLVGGDSDFRQLKNGWGNVGTLYLGYTGAQLDYQNIDISMNGGVLGLTETFYKKNFFNATTISAGATFAEAQTMFGKDDMTMIMAGIANKTGYNWEFKEGKFIIQPNLILSYTMVNNFDYTNSAGVKIKSDPLHSIGVNPNIRFIANTKHGWQPYASVGMVWNIMNDTDVRANSVKLPEMHTKPYIQYGVGLQKHIGDRFAGYAQAMIRNGGRNGIAFTLGFRWALGDHDSSKTVNAAKTVKSIAGFKSAVTSSGSVYKEDVKKNDLRNKPSTPKISFEENGSSAVTSKTVIKTYNTKAKSKNIARYNDLIGG